MILENLDQKSWMGKLMPYFVCFSAALFFAYELMQMHMMNAISPFLMKDLGLNATSFGNLCATYLLADVLILLPAGIILDRLSTRRVILTALLLCIIGTIGFAFAQGFYSAAIFHFLSGIGNAFCFLSCMMLITRWFPLNKQAFIVGLVVTIGMLGGVVAQLPFSMLAEFLTWRKALLVDAAFGIFIYGLIYLFVYVSKYISSKKRKFKPLLNHYSHGLHTKILNYSET
jgi:MFS family permease